MITILISWSPGILKQIRFCLSEKWKKSPKFRWTVLKIFISLQRIRPWVSYDSYRTRRHALNEPGDATRCSLPNFTIPSALTPCVEGGAATCNSGSGVCTQPWPPDRWSSPSPLTNHARPVTDGRPAVKPVVGKPSVFHHPTAADQLSDVRQSVCLCVYIFIINSITLF